MQDNVSAMKIAMHQFPMMNISQTICNILQTVQFHPPCQRVNILTQIRQKATIVGILHNNHVVFCFWILCDSIKFKETVIIQILGMIVELLSK